MWERESHCTKMQKWAERCAKCTRFLTWSWFPRRRTSMLSLEEGTSYRKGIQKSRSFRTQLMSTRLEGSLKFYRIWLRSSKISMHQCWAVEVVAVTAEMLNTKKQSGGLKQATQKRRKKGKEWKGKSCDSKQGNNVLFVFTSSYAFCGKSWACASFQGENTKHNII